MPESKMKNGLIPLFLFLVALLKVNGQTSHTELNGFLLGQYREVATNELGKPFQQNIYEDGFEQEIFLLKPDTSLYMVFEYAAGRTDVIWSIQISGSASTGEIAFKGLKLGLDQKQVQQVLGKPDHTEDIGEYGQRWAYEKENYSVEISKSGKLSSVKITDTYSGQTPDVNKLPKWENVFKSLNSKNNGDIAAVLAPGAEIYYKDQTLFFARSVRTEIEIDHSKVFQTIREISKGLNQINTSDENAFEENMRLSMGHSTKHVIKIKKGHIKEIVFDYINGQYLIWEINAR